MTGGRRPPGLSFLKWVGGKTRYASLLASLVPDDFGTYREPFSGSAALFFELKPDNAVLSDANEELVECFVSIRDQPERVMELLDEMPKTKDFYLQLRSTSPSNLSSAERAARVVYLNKQGFRGLWRVNKKGEFNVPWGDVANRSLYDRDTISRCAELLKSVEIACWDFEQALQKAEAGDFVYLDPPYVPAGGWADFKRYTPGQFHADDHYRLEAAMRSAAEAGVHVLMSNSNTPLVHEIWRDWQISVMSTVRDVNIDVTNRASTDVLVSSFPVTVRGEIDSAATSR